LSAVTLDVADLKESVESTSALARRQRADLLQLTSEIKSLRSINRNQAEEITRLTGYAAHEVKKMKEECEACTSDYRKRRDDVLTANNDIEELKRGLALATKTALEAKEGCSAKNASLRQCLEVLYKETGKWVNAAKEERKTMEREMKKNREDNVEMLENVKREYEKVTSVSKEFLNMFRGKVKALEERTDRIEETTSQLSREVPGVRESAEKCTREALDKMNYLSTEVSGLVNEVRQSAEAEAKLAAEKAGQAINAAKNELEECSRRCQRAVREEVERNESVASELRARMDGLDAMHDDMQVNLAFLTIVTNAFYKDRVYEIDKNRRNNLLFYGLKSKETEGGEECSRKVRSLFNTYLQITREVPLTKVAKLWNGPAFRGVHPVQVSFQFFKDR